MAKSRRVSEEEARRIEKANEDIRREQSEHSDTDLEMPRIEQGYESHRPSEEEEDRDEPVRSRD